MSKILPEIIFFISVIFIMFFMYMVFNGAKKMNKEIVTLKTNCIKTELYVIGNKGHVTSVYDCGK